MKACRFVSLPVLFILLVGCGGQDRGELAQQTVKTYWSDLDNAQMDKAYRLLTPGIQQSRPKNQYIQDMFGFMSSVGNVQPIVKKAQVNGDHAVVPIYLTFVKQQKTLQAYQHLYWYNDGWRIADENGGVSETK